jgi:K+:H+ antiporter
VARAIAGGAEHSAVSGDASEPAVLIQAHVARASLLVIATPDMLKSRKMVQTPKMLNPKIETLLRTHTDKDAALKDAVVQSTC